MAKARLIILALFAAAPLFAQSHDKDFDYLLGDWEFTADSQQYGKFRGYCSAVRVGDNGPILDEYRAVADDGQNYVTRTLRAYNGRQKQWDLVSTDAASGLQNVGTGHREGEEMRIEQKFGVGSDTPSIWRIRYYNIQPDRFSWVADRSSDNGKTWVKDFQKIEARRIGPAHDATQLTKPTKKAR
ncbi:MAG TPA: hypothetical protein VER58_11060 [Thermoanaerobaculia bacterium]|nr:hypothetical protein [Thermoanaerobaculia bacterium]